MIARLKSRLLTKPVRTRRPSPAGRAARLACEPLEARAVPALVDPVFQAGNPTASTLFPGDATLREFKVEPVAGGTYTSADGYLSVTFTVTETPEGPTFNWSSNIGLDAVIVKGGPNANLYNYRALSPEPKADGTFNTSPSGDSDGLHAPVNPSNAKFSGLSHISFIYDLVPAIRIDKVTNGADGLNILAGSPVTWTYTVTNVGDVPLSGVTAADDQGETPAYVSGDTDLDGRLDLTEAWVYEAHDTATAGAHGNVGTATGTFEGQTVSDTDPSSYFGAAPAVAIDKVTVDGPAAGDGLTILTGEDITWLYTVTNTGNVAIGDLTLTDDQGVTPVLRSGDDGDGVLEAGEAWVYAAAGTATAGAYANLGTATGSYTDDMGDSATVTDADPSSYFGADPRIDVEKYVSADGGATWEDADAAAGPYLLTGTDPLFKFVVTNTGNVTLSGLTLADTDFDLSGVTVPATLAAGASFEAVVPAPWAAGQHANTATAGGSFTDDAGHTRPVADADDAHYFGADPAIHIVKVTNGADGPELLVGTPVTWTYTVTNTGNLPLANPTVTDDQGVTPVLRSGDDNDDGRLDLTETWVYTASGTAAAGPYANVGTATGDFNGWPVSDTDPSSYFGADPRLAIEKLTNGEDCPTLTAGDAVTWTYTVTSVGNVPVGVDVLTGVRDDNGTPGDPADDFTPTYVSGDDGDGQVEAWEAWNFLATGTAVLGNYTNLATVTGWYTDGMGNTAAPTATDASCYVGERVFEVGEYTTYTIGGWAAKPRAATVQAILQAGGPVIVPRPSATDISLDTLAEVQAFLRATTNNRYHDTTGPNMVTNYLPSTLEKQFVALSLGVRLGDMSPTVGDLGDLYLAGFAAGDLLGGSALTADQADWLNGLKVRNLLAAAAAFLDGTGSATYGLTASQLNGLLTSLNEAFDNGTMVSGWVAGHLSPAT